MANAPNHEYQANLIRYAASVAYAHLGLYAAREMFGKSYFSLGAHEKAAVDSATLGMVAANFQSLTPQVLTSAVAPSPVGFQMPQPIPPTPQDPKS